MSDSIASEFKKCMEQMSDEQKKDVESIFCCGVLLGLGYGTDGEKEIEIRALEVGQKLEEVGILSKADIKEIGKSYYDEKE